MCDPVKLLALVLVFALPYTCECLKVIPERAAVTYVNESYFTNLTLNVRRIKRGGDYIANLDLILKVEVTNNVTIDIIFYEYLHNEFRRSFVEMHFKACDMILKDPYFGILIRRAGLVKCPIPPGKLSLKNFNFNIDIPFVWPFEKGKGEMIATDDTAGVIMGKGEIVLTFKQ